jgi:ribonuclease P protein component
VSGKLSFPRSRRLTKTAEFSYVRQNGTALRGALLTLAIATVPNSGEKSRLGVVASRRVGGAVLRNRSRRRVREIFRKHQHQLKNGLWIVTILSSRAGRVSFSALQDEWLRLASRASILAP